MCFSVLVRVFLMRRGGKGGREGERERERIISEF